MDKKQIAFNPADFEPVKFIALQFPGATEEVSHYQTPSVKVNGKFMSRLHESGEFIAIRLPFEYREQYLESYPEIFHLPDHYVNYPFICFWVNKCPKKLLTEIITLSWKSLATKKQLKEREGKG
jgi:hypothetical protein